MKSAYKNNEFKISAPTWNDEFDLPDGSNSISDIKNYEAIEANPSVQIYTNKI